MAIITIPRKRFEREIGKLSEGMQEKINLFGTPIEALDNEELQLEIFPNRPDMLSYYGFRRSFMAFLERKTGLKKYRINPPQKDYKIKIDSSVKNIRPYTACAIVKGIHFDSEKIKEVIELQEKIHITLGRNRKKIAIGIYPLEKIKLPITFKALEPDKIKFIPLECQREMSGLEILRKHSTGKKYAHLLAGKIKFPIFIDKNKNILSMPPIINSQLTGQITENTRDIFIECSGFDMELLKKCLNIITGILSDMGGKIYQMHLKGTIKEKTPVFKTKKKKISLENTNKKLGLNLEEKDLKKLLEKMGHNYKNGLAEIAPWRTDILHEVDLIEDVAIAYGYNNFHPEIPNISTLGEENKEGKIKKKIAEILSGLQMLEVSNYHLTNKENQFKRMGIPEKKEKEFVEVEESKTDYNILRKNLAHCLLKNLSENVDSKYPQDIFELGKIFKTENKKIIEKERIAIAVAPGNYTKAKQILEYLSKSLDIDLKVEEPDKCAPHFIEERTAKIIAGKKKIGEIGEIHPKILKNWKIKKPVAILEINLEGIFEGLG